MSDSQGCVDIAGLQALLDGGLSEESQSRIAAHLESCTTCQHQLELLAGGAAAVAVRGATSGTFSDALKQAIQKVKDASQDDTRTLGETQSSALSFSFLGPAENPRHLGRMGAYEILELIGRGGMGIVFKGRDRKLERLVAVKVLSPELSSSVPARQRFLREAKSAAAVTHEHVVTIHAVDEANGTPFLVMEYIVGVSLEDRIQRSGHLRVEEILRIGMQIAAGLAAAHAQGLVHRDIKPSNILLENGVERVKITDFGLARVVHEVQLTQTNAVAGTPQYMSPEQARGDQVDHRSDLFSLGCVMYAMCAGRSPFRADTPTGAIHRVCEDAPRPIREINPDIPDWLHAVIDRLLAKKPESRFQTAGEVAALLSDYLAHVQQPSRVRLPKATRADNYGFNRNRSRGWKLAAFTFAAIGVLGISEFTGVTHLLPKSEKPTMGPELTSGGSNRQPTPVELEKNHYNSIDIQPKANARITDAADTEGDDLSAVPRHLETPDHVSFQIGERVIRLGGESPGKWPEKIEKIEVGDYAGTFHFLCGARQSNSLKGVLGYFTVRYEDDSIETIPLIEGQNIQDWRNPRRLTSVGWTSANGASHPCSLFHVS